MDPDRTAPTGAFLSGFTLFIYEASNVLVDDNKTLWTQIRLLLQEHSDLGSHCLSMRLQMFLWTTTNIHM